MLTEYLLSLLFIVVTLLFALGSIFLSALAGPKRSIAVKGEPYECGIPASPFRSRRWPHDNWRFCWQGGWICRSGPSKVFWGEEG